MPDRRVLVVGTTSDYIDIISHRYPGRALFVTDPAERRKAVETAPDTASEVLCDLTRPDQVRVAVCHHLEQYGIEPSGITAFDCESMALAAQLAEHLNLPYPSLSVIRTVRDKFLTKRAWMEHGVRCPKAALVASEQEALAFKAALPCPVVLKPLTGSGSELTFRCADRYDTLGAFRMLRAGLKAREGSRMYSTAPATSGGKAASAIAAIEEFIEGREYSCDFIISDGAAELIRVAKKIKPEQMPFGTTRAYVLPARLPEDLTEQRLLSRLRKAALALGLSRAICMVDFIVRDGEPIFLEMTPRPGGDCLPSLIRRSCGLDVLGLALDFAEGRKVAVPPPSEWRQLVGLRLFASEGGRIRNLDISGLASLPDVLECYIKRRPGHVVALPPADYDSWLLGHVIFQPADLHQVEQECATMAARLTVDMEPFYDESSDQLRPADRRTAGKADAAA